MFCTNCSKLLFSSRTRKCVKCGRETPDNLSVLCATCSDKNKQCSVCLKKIQNFPLKRGCNCGGN